MADVWAAHDLELDRRVAIKLLGPRADPARFEREARAIAALAHPNICQLYDYGESDGRRYMVLEYLPGGTLEDRLPPDAPGSASFTRGRSVVRSHLRPFVVITTMVAPRERPS